MSWLTADCPWTGVCISDGDRGAVLKADPCRSPSPQPRVHAHSPGHGCCLAELPLPRSLGPLAAHHSFQKLLWSLLGQADLRACLVRGGVPVCPLGACCPLPVAWKALERTVECDANRGLLLPIPPLVTSVSRIPGPKRPFVPAWVAAGAPGPCSIWCPSEHVHGEAPVAGLSQRSPWPHHSAAPR